MATKPKAKLKPGEYRVPGYSQGGKVYPDQIKVRGQKDGPPPQGPKGESHPGTAPILPPQPTTPGPMRPIPASGPNAGLPIQTGNPTNLEKGVPILPNNQVQKALLTPGAGASYAKGGMVHGCPTCQGPAHYANGGFISAAIKHPGREKRAAAKAGMSTHAYMEKHQHDSGSEGDAARLGLRLEGYEGGGPVQGPGTGTSDSIHAMVSNGEYVIPEHVVSFLGQKFFDDLVDKAENEMGMETSPDQAQEQSFSDLAGDAPGAAGG